MKPLEAEIIQRVCNVFGVTRADLMSRKRKREVSQARQAAIFAIIRLRYTQEQAGAVFNRDHSTVAHAIRTIENLCEVYPEFKRSVDCITSSTQHDQAKTLRMQFYEETGRHYYQSWGTYTNWLEDKIINQ